MNRQSYYLVAVCERIAMALVVILCALIFQAPAQENPQAASKLTGNWVVKTLNSDGTFRATYLNLKQDGQHITGSIRVTQFYYQIAESTAGPDGFTLVGSMKDGKSDRRVRYEVKLVGAS